MNEKDKNIESLLEAANHGQPEAEFRLGAMYAERRGTKKDDDEAQRWYLKAAEAGHREAFIELGLMLLAGRGTKKANLLGLECFRIEAEEGDAGAQYVLGALYADGRVVEKSDAEASKWYRRAAEQGFREAQFRLGTAYHVGLGVEPDDAEASRWLRKAADQGHGGALHELSLMAGGSTEEGNAAREPTEAQPFHIPELLPARAEQGDPVAQEVLGQLYLAGLGVKQDDAEAATWFRKAAEQGDAKAQRTLGALYLEGRGVMQDDVEAAMWFRKAAEQGHAMGQFSLGFMYAEGRGVKRDDAEAATWYRKGAEQGEALAQHGLAFAYFEGRGVKRDDAEAATWYRKAAEQGHAGAQCSLGYIYEKGGLIAEAATWYRKAAEQGNPEAQHNLGALYAQGRGLKQDYAEAVKWFRKAADQGMPGSQLALGLLSELGIGMPRNYSQAITWYQRAAESGQPDAQYRLGNMHLLGRGVPADPAEAAKWFGMAAEKNVADAEYALGQLYDGGVGVAQDRIKAQELFRRAADHGSAGAKERIQQAKNPEAASKSEMPERRASEELNELIGMQGVKEEVRGLQALLWMQRQRTQQGLKTIDPTLHLVFTGGPGTGKTTVARIVAKIYREAGILPKGHLVEVDRAALVGTYLGQTAPKTTDVVESAMGGVLFIDEAYSLVARNAGFQDAYGQEVISTLLKLMEDKRGRFALIVAGYPEEMKAFLESNPGLRSRFPKQIHFPDYSARELGEIFRLLLKKSDLEGTAAALAKVDKYLESILKVADKRTFGNAREVRTIVECAQVNQAERLHESRADLTASRMRTLTPEDFEFLATRLREESPRAATPRNATR